LWSKWHFGPELDARLPFCKIQAMSDAERVSGATRDVLQVLLDACDQSVDLDGWDIKQQVRRSGHAVYKVIDKLESRRLIEGKWLPQADRDESCQRRCYRLTTSGTATALRLLGHSEMTLTLATDNGAAVEARIKSVS
jgi:DNA-binding PadR family transcriptional regulator